MPGALRPGHPRSGPRPTADGSPPRDRGYANPAVMGMGVGHHALRPVERHQPGTPFRPDQPLFPETGRGSPRPTDRSTPHRRPVPPSVTTHQDPAISPMSGMPTEHSPPAAPGSGRPDWPRHQCSPSQSSLVRSGRAAGGAPCPLDGRQLARLPAALDAGPAAYGWDEDHRWTLEHLPLSPGPARSVDTPDRSSGAVIISVGRRTESLAPLSAACLSLPSRRRSTCGA